MQQTFISVTEDGGVKKKIISEGTGEQPKVGDSCSMYYTGSLTNGTQFDSNVGGKVFKFDLGQGQVIKGWDVGVASMKLGEKAILQLSSGYGYGNAGSPPEIPPKAALIFQVELVDFKTTKKKKK